tara:strand:+ start:15272 stop:15403 length:132 start_codon:yes stop_codon:yes gene_type:complete
MSIVKCLDCERRIDIDIEEVHWVNDFEVICDDCKWTQDKENGA